MNSSTGQKQNSEKQQNQKKDAIIKLKHLPIEQIAAAVGCSRPYVHAVLRSLKEKTAPQYFKHDKYYTF